MKWWPFKKRERPFKFMELKRLMEMYVKAAEDWDVCRYPDRDNEKLGKVRLLAYELQKRTKEDRGSK